MWNLYDFRCPMSEFRCPMSVIWCPMYDVHCLLSDVRCLMSHVKYIYFPLSSDFRFLVHLLEIRSLLRMTLSFLRALTWICMPEKSGIRFVLCSFTSTYGAACFIVSLQWRFIFYFWFCPFVWLLMYHWGQVFPRYFRLFIITNWMFSWQIITPPLDK